MPKESENFKEWTITIDSFGGFCPSFFDNSYPYYGNKNQASAMTDCDIRDLNVLTQGAGIAALIAGTQAGALDANVVSILKHATSTNVSFAIEGGALLHRISATAVLNAGIWPHTITGTGTVTGQDVVYYNSLLLYSYLDSTVGGQIGSYDLATTFDDDYWTVALSGTALVAGVPHYMLVGGDDILAITNGQYIATLDGTTDNDKALDFWNNSVVVTITWNWNRYIIGVNRPNISGSNFNLSGIYTWNGTASSWEGDPIEVNGEIGALYTKNGTTYCWWKDSTTTGAYNFGYINGSRLDLIRRYSGSLPNQAQVGEYDGFVAWLSSGVLNLWGSKDADLPVQFFRYMTAGYTTTPGGFACPFGTPIIGSSATTNYQLGVATGISTGARYNTMAFKMSGPNFKSQIDTIMIETEQMATGAKVDATLTYDQGKSTQSLTQIAYVSTLPTRHKILNRGPQVEDFRLDFSWANGSTTNPVKIRSVMIMGHYIIND